MDVVHIDRLGRMVDGVIVATSRFPREKIAAFALRYPLINREVGEVPSVVIDTARGMMQEAEHLASPGHRSATRAAESPQCGRQPQTLA